MDIGEALVASLIQGGLPAWKLAIQKGITDKDVAGDARHVLGYITGYVEQYRSLPTREIIATKTGVTIDHPGNSLEFCIDEILDARLQRILEEGARPFVDYIHKGEPRKAVTELQALFARVNKAHLLHSPAESMMKLIPKVLEHYDKMKAGERGIPYPFPSLNEATLGLWPQDLVLFVSRLGVGKTFLMLLTVRSAWQAGKRILLATTEMSKDRMAQRFFAQHLKLPYGFFRRGELPPLIEDKMRQTLKILMDEDDDRLKVIGGDFDFSPETLGAEIDDMMPDLVVLDGAYLLRSQGHTRTEQAANTFNDLKRLANRSKIPLVVSSQLNREAKRNSPGTIQVENIGLTDVAGWNADVAYGLLQTDEMFHDKRMIFKPLKVREGRGEEFECIWDVDNMEFTELPKDGQRDTKHPFDSTEAPF